MSGSASGASPSKRSSRAISDGEVDAPAIGAPRQRAATRAQFEAEENDVEMRLIGGLSTAVSKEEDEAKAGRRAKFSIRAIASRLMAAFVSCLESKRAKRVISTIVGFLFLVLLADELFAPPDKRLVKPSSFGSFLAWVQTHPLKGLAAFVVVYAMTIACLLPGTPLTIGSGYIYKAAYGWGLGIAIGSIFSTLGSLLGSIMCFLLGRYLMRDRVQIWVRNYPMFDALDAALKEKGFKIMALLYLTPILPLGPVSYMIGTTSMSLAQFAAAKIACVPMMAFYVFLGASTRTIIQNKASTAVSEGGTVNLLGQEGLEGDGGDMPEIVTKGESTHMVMFGVCLSAFSVALISHVVKKELLKILDKQKAEFEEGDEGSENQGTQDLSISAGADSTTEKKVENFAMRQRGKATQADEENLLDEDRCKSGRIS